MSPFNVQPLLIRCQTQWAIADAAASQSGTSRSGAAPQPGVCTPATLREEIAFRERQRALALSSQLAARLFGVSLGQCVTVIDTDSGGEWELLVDYLRPTRKTTPILIACSGEDDSPVRPFFLLGTDNLVVHACGASNVLQLNSFLARRRP